jgi:hypothetical protein
MVYGLNRLMLGALCFSAVVLPSFAQETNAGAKKLGKTGIYGNSSLDALEEPAPTEAERVEEKAKQERLKAKYPLSRTSASAGNEKASLLLLKGIQQYQIVRARFDAINEIKSTYDKETSLLKIQQKGIVSERLQPRDLIQYGPEYAHIGLRIRALQNTDKIAAQALSYFSQAQSLAPSVAVIPKWVKIAKDTRQALQYHSRFYQVALKAVSLGYDDTQIENLALRWNAGPRNLGPASELTTRVYAKPFERNSITGTEQREAPKLDSFTDKLPSLDFEIKDF